jgi:hypothetical protein
MIFPFSVCFSRSLKTIITADNKEQLTIKVQHLIGEDHYLAVLTMVSFI